jgi:hypothetical protein
MPVVSDIPSYTIPELFLWGIVVSVLTVCGLYFIIFAHKKEDNEEKNILIGFSCVFFGIALARTFYFLNKAQLQGVVIGFSFYGYEGYNYPGLFSLLESISPLIAFASLIFVFEKTFLRTKLLITIVNIGLIILYTILRIIMPEQVGFLDNLNTIIVALNFFFYILIIFMLIKKSPVEFQFTVISFLLGSFIVFAGHAIVTMGLEAEFVFDLGLPREIAPLLHLIGAYVMISPTIISPKFYMRFLSYWYLIALVFVALTPFLIYFIIVNVFLPYSGLDLNPIILLIGIIVYSFFACFIVYKILKMAKKKNLKREEEAKNLLQIFSKPQKLTEEEVSISKEKRICLVCKGKLQRVNYICPDCYALYCIKCADTLGTLENSCWVCTTPFDASKPIKEPMEEEIVYEKDFKKKGKNKKDRKSSKSLGPIDKRK